MKRVFSILLTLCLLLCLTACGEEAAGSELVGTWYDTSGDAFIFNEDGTGFDSTGDSFNWSVDGNSLTLTGLDNGNSALVFTYTIEGDTLTMSGDGEREVLTRNYVPDKSDDELAAPAPEEAAFPLPFGLTFGMTYDQFAAKLAENGLTAAPLEAASNNAGYFPDGVELPLDNPAVWDFIGSQTLKSQATAQDDPTYNLSAPKLFASFNQGQELYEVYIGWTFYVESFALTVCDELAATYDAYFGVESTSSQWENEEYSVSFSQQNDVTYLLVIHDFAHDLDAWLAN